MKLSIWLIAMSLIVIAIESQVIEAELERIAELLEHIILK